MSSTADCVKFREQVARASTVLHDPAIPAAEARGRAMSCLATALDKFPVIDRLDMAPAAVSRDINRGNDL